MLLYLWWYFFYYFKDLWTKSQTFMSSLTPMGTKRGLISSTQGQNRSLSVNLLAHLLLQAILLKFNTMEHKLLIWTEWLNKKYQKMFNSQQKLKKIYNLWLALVEMIASKSFKHDILKLLKFKIIFVKNQSY